MTKIDLRKEFDQIAFIVQSAPYSLPQHQEFQLSLSKLKKLVIEHLPEEITPSPPPPQK